jgi:predicted Zn-dependent protease with MMP-like domain
MADPAPHTLRHTTPPSLSDLETLAAEALAAIPARLRRRIDNLAIAVEDEPDDETLDEMGIENPWELTGLYHGTPLGQRSVDDVARTPDLVTLYRLPILLEWVEEGEDLARLVRSVLVHEIAHHFGFTDAEITALEREMG